MKELQKSYLENIRNATIRPEEKWKRAKRIQGKN